MPNLLSPLWPARDARTGLLADAQSLAPDDDLALGFECANPMLQLDGWEPAPLMPATAPSSC